MSSYSILTQGQKIDKAAKALILLHGRGGTASDILHLAPKICDDTFYIVAPQAPQNSWYPYSFMEEEKLNEPWLSSSVKLVKNLIDDIATSLPIHQIYIVGFSQGACLALEVSTRFAAPYGGIVAFSGGLIGKTLHETKYKGDFAGTKVFIGNSDRDPHIPLVRSKQSEELMQKRGAHVTLKVYPGMGHTINEDEINWVKQMLTS